MNMSTAVFWCMKKMLTAWNRAQQLSFFSAGFKVSVPVMVKELDLTGKRGRLKVNKALGKESRGTAPTLKKEKGNHRVSEGR